MRDSVLQAVTIRNLLKKNYGLLSVFAQFPKNELRGFLAVKSQNKRRRGRACLPLQIGFFYPLFEGGTGGGCRVIFFKKS